MQCNQSSCIFNQFKCDLNVDFRPSEPRDDAFCLGLNLNISKLVYFIANGIANVNVMQWQEYKK